MPRRRDIVSSLWKVLLRLAHLVCKIRGLVVGRFRILTGFGFVEGRFVGFGLGVGFDGSGCFGYFRSIYYLKPTDCAKLMS